TSTPRVPVCPAKEGSNASSTSSNERRRGSSLRRRIGSNTCGAVREEDAQGKCAWLGETGQLCQGRGSRGTDRVPGVPRLERRRRSSGACGLDAVQLVV